MKYQSTGEFVRAEGKTPNQTFAFPHFSPARVTHVFIQDGQVANDGSDTETITVEVVDGLEVARGTDPAEATVLDYDGDVTLTIDGAVETTKTLTDGSVSFDVTTEKPAGTTIEIVAESLADHPAESDRVEIEVTQA